MVGTQGWESRRIAGVAWDLHDTEGLEVMPEPRPWALNVGRLWVLRRWVSRLAVGGGEALVIVKVLLPGQATSSLCPRGARH